MATRMNLVSGDWTTAGTWGTCDSTAELDSEAGTTNISTSNLDSSTFTPGVITVRAIAVKISSVVTPTGTFSCTLRNSTGGANVETVTVNAADLPASGWVVFRFTGDQILLAATAYLIRVVRSVADGAADRITLFRDATANNWTRQLRTTATGAPVAADKLIVAGELTGAGTGNNLTVTMNETATTDYGTGSTTLSSLSVNVRGTLTWAVVASTNYYLKLSGILDVYGGGTMNVGTVATPMPATSTAKIEFDSAVNVDFGLRVQVGGTLVMQGAVKTTVQTLLTADVAATGTVLTVAATAGWAVSDKLGIASTSRTSTECEQRVILTVDSATQVTLTAGVTNAHSGTSPTQAEVINLTRNVQVFGASATLQGYVSFATTGIVDIDYVEFFQLGSATANKRGLDVATTTGTCNVQFSALRDFSVTGSRGFNVSSASGSGITISNNMIYNINDSHIINVATSGTHTYANNIGMLNVANSIFQFPDAGVTITGNTAVGSINNGFTVGQIDVAFLAFTGNTAHSNALVGISITAASSGGTIGTSTIWRNNSFGFSNTVGVTGLTIDTMTAFGNVTANIRITGNGVGQVDCLYKSLTLSGDTTFSTGVGLSINGPSFACGIVIQDSTFGVVSGIKTAHTTADIQGDKALQIRLKNVTLASGTEVASQTNMTANSEISSARHDQTAGNHKVFKGAGTLTNDTTIFATTPSQRLTPNQAGVKLESSYFLAAVVSGGTPTLSVDVRTSVAGDGTAYNGVAPRLVVKANPALGLAADTVLDTHSLVGGAFETLTGAAPAPTDDGVLEFFVDCDGTTGWVNVDTIVVSPTQDSKVLKFFREGGAFVAAASVIAAAGVGGALSGLSAISGVSAVFGVLLFALGLGAVIAGLL